MIGLFAGALLIELSSTRQMPQIEGMEEVWKLYIKERLHNYNDNDNDNNNAGPPCAPEHPTVLVWLFIYVLYERASDFWGLVLVSSTRRSFLRTSSISMLKCLRPTGGPFPQQAALGIATHRPAGDLYTHS